MRPNNGLLVLWITFKRDGVRDPSVDESDGTPPSRRLQRRKTAPAESVNYEKKMFFHSDLLLANTSITISCYKVLKSLGEGTYGFVRLAYHQNDPEQIPVVIKYVLKSKVLRWIRRPDIGGRVPVELAILFDLTLIPHRSIPRLLTSFQDEFYNYIVMPYHSSHDLFDWIENNTSPVEDDLKYIFSQILLAVNHLHVNKIVHRDIKVLIFNQPRMKI
jgi:serine/threonine protein kinase